MTRFAAKAATTPSTAATTTTTCTAETTTTCFTATAATTNSTACRAGTNCTGGTATTGFSAKTSQIGFSATPATTCSTQAPVMIDSKGGDNDKLYGEGENDTLWGDSGNDTLFGGDGREMLGGDDRMATLTGSNDNEHDRWPDFVPDTLDGGTGIYEIQWFHFDEIKNSEQTDNVIFQGPTAPPNTNPPTQTGALTPAQINALQSGLPQLVTWAGSLGGQLAAGNETLGAILSDTFRRGLNHDLLAYLGTPNPTLEGVGDILRNLATSTADQTGLVVATSNVAAVVTPVTGGPRTARRPQTPLGSTSTSRRPGPRTRQSIWRSSVARPRASLAPSRSRSSQRSVSTCRLASPVTNSSSSCPAAAFRCSTPSIRMASTSRSMSGCWTLRSTAANWG